MLAIYRQNVIKIPPLRQKRIALVPKYHISIYLILSHVYIASDPITSHKDMSFSEGRGSVTSVPHIPWWHYLCWYSFVSTLPLLGLACLGRFTLPYIYSLPSQYIVVLYLVVLFNTPIWLDSILILTLLEFCISLLNDPTTSDEINYPFIISLAVLGVTSIGFHGPEVYLSKLSAILKASRFLVLRYSYEETTTYSSEIEIDNSDFNSSSRLGLALKNQ